MKYLIYIVTLCLSLSLLNCEDYLDIVPDNIATIDYAFFDRVGAERFLFTCYSYLPELGDLDKDPSIIGGDEIFIHDMNQFYSPQWTSYLIKYEQNADNPYVNYWDGSGGGSNLMIAITDCNIFLENIFKVPDLEDYEKRRWAAEVKFLKAYYHFYLLRMYGPIPINDVNLPVSASQDEVRVYRQPFDECVKYIVDLIHESVPDLPLRISDRSTEMGRITQPIALALKAKLLLTSASPLFNGNQDYANFRDNRGVNLFNTEYDVDKWKIALDATKNAIDTAWLAGHTLYEFSDAIYDLSDTTKTLMSIRNAYGHKWNEEVVWGFTNSALYHLQKFSKPMLSIDDKSLQTSEPILSPSLKIVELFYSKNGVPIEEDLDYDYRNRFKVETSTSERYYIDKGTKTAILNQFREPRFYANLSFDNSIWYGNGRYRDVGTQPSSETPWVVRGKAGETSGRTSATQYSISGYNVKKYVHFQTITGRTGSTWERMSFPAIRLADLYLMYAEARNEFYGPDEEAFIFIDLVRERAGLSGVLESWHNHSIYPDKPSTKEGFREIIRRERINELAFEGKRFWDLRRWKTALTEINNSRVQGWNVNGENEVEYYEVVDFQNPLKFTTKEYLWPISQRELRRNPNLIQNPYWKN